MNDLITAEIAPEMALLLSLIDSSLQECIHRSIVSANEMADMLLDIRVAALAVGVNGEDSPD
jgi:hypothetical protein